MVHEKGKQNSVQVWAGIECSINRVEDQFHDQLQFADLYSHPEWLKHIVDLGIKTLRFPILWEKHQPRLNDKIDWRFTEDQLIILKENGVAPIAGLLHHGSGPAFTNLSDPTFPLLFAGYAKQVAEKFPWIEYYTPINEPLTTARFSGLYGLWFPHKKNDTGFVKMLLNQLKATVLGMREIRMINPGAKLIQTEDLGKTYSTPLLSYQADFENKRRWLTYDILCGTVDNTHSLWNYFERLGIDKETMQFFIDNPCKPDIIGVNHYITSERYIDEHIENYPALAVGGNSLHHYVDVEAIRVQMQEPHGIELLLREIWNKYHIPLAITEAHLHCSREEQLRWFKELYDITLKLQTDHIDITAITAWAVFGSFGWNRLLTFPPGYCEYETGALDISGGYPRITALFHLVKNLILKKPVNLNLLDQPGWWKLESRYLIKGRKKENTLVNPSPQPLVIIGKTGTLGKAFSRICRERNIYHCLLGRDEVDICNSSEVETMINRYHPWAIINAAGFVKVDAAETEPELCYRENYLGSQKLAILCEKYKIKLVGFSSDLVFDGNKTLPYTENDEPNPLNVYGKSKQLAEIFLNNVNPGSLIIRTSSFFGPWDQHNFAYHILSDLIAGKRITVSADITISPTYVPHLVHASLDLLIDNEKGTWHLINKGRVTWYEFAKMIAMYNGFDTGLIRRGQHPISKAARPLNSALTSIKYYLMPSLEKALEEFSLQYKTHLKERISI